MLASVDEEDLAVLDEAREPRVSDLDGFPPDVLAKGILPGQHLSARHSKVRPRAVIG
jgi:hypothetical protein